MQQGRMTPRALKILKNLYFPVLAFLAAFIVGSIVILSTSSKNPLEVYGVMVRSAFGGIKALDATLVKAIPFMFTGLSYAIAKRCGVINLGAEGQFKIGALCATFVGVTFGGLPAAIHLPLTLLAGFLGGALYGLIVALLKIKFGSSELITTIMFNYVATQIIGFFVTGPLKESAASSYPQTAMVLPSAQLPRFFGGGLMLHTGFILVLLMLVFFYIFLWKSTPGYQMRVVGMSPTAGQYAGMHINRSVLLSMLLAGGFAGLGGCVEIIAVQSRLMITSFSVSYGFTGIAVALVGNNNPVGIFLSGILFGGLQSGAMKMQIITGVSSSIAQVVEALVILFFAGREIFTPKRRGASKSKGFRKAGGKEVRA